MTGLRYDNRKLGFMETEPTEDGYLLNRVDPLRILLICKPPTRSLLERADFTSNTDYDWLLDHAFSLVPRKTTSDSS